MYEIKRKCFGIEVCGMFEEKSTKIAMKIYIFIYLLYAYIWNT